MTTTESHTESMLIEDEKTGKKLEIFTSSDETDFHISAYPICGGDDEIALDLSYEEAEALYLWLKRVLGE